MSGRRGRAADSTAPSTQSSALLPRARVRVDSIADPDLDFDWRQRAAHTQTRSGSEHPRGDRIVGPASSTPSVSLFCFSVVLLAALSMSHGSFPFAPVFPLISTVFSRKSIPMVGMYSTLNSFCV